MSKTVACFLNLALNGGILLAVTPEESLRLRQSKLAETVNQWVKSEQLASKEAADWQNKQAQMKEILTLHRQELALLDEQLRSAGDSVESTDKKREESKEKIAKLQAERQAFMVRLSQLQGRALKLSQALPAPLQANVVENLQVIRDSKAQEASRDILQSIISVINAADEFNASITVHPEVRNGKEVQVLYLGLAQAFYVSADGKIAGTGHPAGTAWQWQENAALAPEIARALSIYRKESRPGFVKLPIEIR